MRYDWSPLWRSTIGFDRLFDALDEVQRTSEDPYPPYNIERVDENRFRIAIALAGFTPDEVSLTVEQNILTLEGQKAEKNERNFLHRGYQRGRSNGSLRLRSMSRSKAPDLRTAC